MGRPSLYSTDLGEAICERLESGEPLAHICRGEDMPGVRTVLRWAAENPEFAGLYKLAQEAQGEHLDAEIHDTAQTAKDKDTAAAARVKINALQWRASKLNRRLADRVDLNVDHTFNLAAELGRRRQQVLEGREEPAALPGAEGTE